MTTAFQSNAFQTNAFQIDATPIITSVIGHGPGWKIIFDQDVLAKWEKERSNEESRKKFIGSLFARIYGSAPDDESPAVSPAIGASDSERVLADLREAKAEREKSEQMSEQVRILGALHKHALELERLRRIREGDEDDDDIIMVLH